jgi:transketolase
MIATERQCQLPQLKNIAAQVRQDILCMVYACQSGHPGGSHGCTDIVVSLYFEIMKQLQYAKFSIS